MVRSTKKSDATKNLTSSELSKLYDEIKMNLSHYEFHEFIMNIGAYAHLFVIYFGVLLIGWNINSLRYSWHIWLAGPFFVRVYALGANTVLHPKKTNVNDESMVTKLIRWSLPVLYFLSAINTVIFNIKLIMDYTPVDQYKRGVLVGTYRNDTNAGFEASPVMGDPYTYWVFIVWSLLVWVMLIVHAAEFFSSVYNLRFYAKDLSQKIYDMIQSVFGTSSILENFIQIFVPGYKYGMIDTETGQKSKYM